MLDSLKQCVPLLDNWCIDMAVDGSSCLLCKGTFYLKGGKCLPFPPFCLNYSTSCTLC